MKNKKLFIFAMFALSFFIFLYPELTLYLALRLVLTLGILLIVLALLKMTNLTLKAIGKDGHNLLQKLQVSKGINLTKSSN